MHAQCALGARQVQERGEISRIDLAELQEANDRKIKGGKKRALFDILPLDYCREVPSAAQRDHNVVGAKSGFSASPRHADRRKVQRQESRPVQISHHNRASICSTSLDRGAAAH
jgi:hypothetical protein